MAHSVLSSSGINISSSYYYYAFLPLTPTVRASVSPSPGHPQRDRERPLFLSLSIRRIERGTHGLRVLLAPLSFYPSVCSLRIVYAVHSVRQRFRSPDRLCAPPFVGHLHTQNQQQINKSQQSMSADEVSDVTQDGRDRRGGTNGRVRLRENSLGLKSLNYDARDSLNDDKLFMSATRAT